jgi:hypothetical protein
MFRHRRDYNAECLAALESECQGSHATYGVIGGTKAALEKPAAKTIEVEITRVESVEELVSEAKELMISSLPLALSQSMQADVSRKLVAAPDVSRCLRRQISPLQQHHVPTQKRMCLGDALPEASQLHSFVNERASRVLQQNIQTNSGSDTVGGEPTRKRKRAGTNEDDEWQSFNEDLFLDADESLAEAGLTFEVRTR